MVTPFQPCAPGLTAQLETGPAAAPTVAPVLARPAVRPHIVIVRARQRRFPCDQVAEQIGGSRACGVTPAATFGDGVAVAVMVWHECVRVFESGGLPACIQHRRARSLRGTSGGLRSGRGSAPRASMGRMHTWWQGTG